MASTRVIKGRIRSVKNTRQITKAMQLVAASKMRRAQENTKASLPYAAAARELLAALVNHVAVKEHPLFVKRPVKTRLFIVVASDKGLAGAYNNNIIKAYLEQLKADETAGIKNKTITVGRKAAQFVAHVKGTEVIGSYEDLPDRPEGRTFYAILDTVRNMFISGEVDEVEIIFTEYISSIKQNVKTLRVLPAGFRRSVIETSAALDAVYEPDVSTVLDGVAHRLVGTQIFQALLEARASEYCMRMIAMKNSTDNASDLIDDLTLAMNKARQGAITQELAEISGGAEVVNE